MSHAVATTAEQVLLAVESNHVYLNAMRCVNPTPEFCEGLGRDIIAMLKHRESLLPKFMPNLEQESDNVREALLDMGALTPTLYLSINKS